MWPLRRRARAESQDETAPDEPSPDGQDSGPPGWTHVAAMPLVSRAAEPTIAPDFEASLTTRHPPVFLQNIASTVRPPGRPTEAGPASEGTRVFAPHPAS